MSAWTALSLALIVVSATAQADPVTDCVQRKVRYVRAVKEDFREQANPVDLAAFESFYQKFSNQASKPRPQRRLEPRKFSDEEKAYYESAFRGGIYRYSQNKDIPYEILTILAALHFEANGLPTATFWHKRLGYTVQVLPIPSQKRGEVPLSRLAHGLERHYDGTLLVYAPKALHKMSAGFAHSDPFFGKPLQAIAMPHDSALNLNSGSSSIRHEIWHAFRAKLTRLREQARKERISKNSRWWRLIQPLLDLIRQRSPETKPADLSPRGVALASRFIIEGILLRTGELEFPVVESVYAQGKQFSLDELLTNAVDIQALAAALHYRLIFEQTPNPSPEIQDALSRSSDVESIQRTMMTKVGEVLALAAQVDAVAKDLEQGAIDALALDLFPKGTALVGVGRNGSPKPAYYLHYKMPEAEPGLRAWLSTRLNNNSDEVTRAKEQLTLEIENMKRISSHINRQVQVMPALLVALEEGRLLTVTHYLHRISSLDWMRGGPERGPLENLEIPVLIRGKALYLPSPSGTPREIKPGQRVIYDGAEMILTAITDKTVILTPAQPTTGWPVRSIKYLDLLKGEKTLSVPGRVKHTISK